MSDAKTVTIETIVDVIFKKLSLAYGRDFTGRWEGLDMQDVKADWEHELSGYENNTQAIKYALQNLPASKPPTVFEFRAIAQRAPETPRPQLEAPRANPEVVQAALRAARAALTRAAQ